MYLRLFLIIIVGLVSIEAMPWKKKPGTVIKTDQTWWRRELSEMYGKFWRKQTFVESTVIKLNELNLYEQSPEFLLDIEKLDKSYSLRVRDVFDFAMKISIHSSLLHKPEILSKQLVNLLSNHQGCSSDEISKIERIKGIFRQGSRIEKTLAKKIEQEIIVCWFNYKTLIRAAFHLIGHNDLMMAMHLHNRIDKKSLEAYAEYHYDAKPEAIESLAHSLASYMMSLDHPDLDSISVINSAHDELLLEEIYKIEVQEPCDKLCNLYSPVKRYFSGLTKSTYGERTNFSKDTNIVEIALEFSCDLSSFAYGSLRSKIWQHFMELKRKSY